MKFDYPSWAEDYEFIVMVKNTAKNLKMGLTIVP
jgi:hypothetical protein